MPTPAAAAPHPVLVFLSGITAWGRRHATVYHLFIVAVLGGFTVAFTALIAILIIISSNFNVLGWIE